MTILFDRCNGRWFLAQIAVALFCMCMVGIVHAFTVPPNDGYVTDAAGILGGEERQTLTQMIDSYRVTTTNEIAIVTIPTLDGTAIADAALEVARKWKVGSAKNNGILLFIVYQDREVRIEVGYGLEGAIPDIIARGIIDMDIVPAFREGRYFDGLSAAIHSLQKHIGGEYTADRYQLDDSEGIVPFMLFLSFILLQWLLAIMGRTKSWWLGGIFGGIGGLVLVAMYGWWLSIPILIALGLLLDYVVSKNYHRRGGNSWWVGGGWGGGSSTGGNRFGGFGGGSFGGGGASGKW